MRYASKSSTALLRISEKPTRLTNWASAFANSSLNSTVKVTIEFNLQEPMINILNELFDNFV